MVALIRGDHELNENKFLRHLGVQKLEKAKEEDYRKVADCEVGFAGPVGLKARLVADYSVKTVRNGISGANKKDFHLTNINLDRDYRPQSFADLRLAQAGERCGRCGSSFEFSRGIEAGHTFKLGTKYSRAMGANYLNEKRQSLPMVMGCYGIGISRIVAAAIEQCRDEAGILWPPALAPYQALILPLDYHQPRTREVAEALYREFREKGVETLLDDRDERAGVKFNDADLLGIPLRITLGSKGLSLNQVEIQARSEKTPTRIPVERALAEFLHILTGENPPC